MKIPQIEEIHKITPEVKPSKTVKTSVWHDIKIVALTYLYTALTILVMLGVAYICNFQVKISRNVQVISPVALEK